MNTEQSNTIAYRVALTDGWIVDSEGQYIRDCITDDCGHNHRTEQAALTCQQKLMNWSKDGKTCSAHWYNSTVLTVDKSGRHVPQKDGEI